VDDVALEPGREDARVLSEPPAAASLVDVQEPIDRPPDDADTRALAASALVVRDDRRGDIELVGQLRLGDVEVSPPLSESRSGVVAERYLAGDPAGELLACVAHDAIRRQSAAKDYRNRVSSNVDSGSEARRERGRLAHLTRPSASRR